MTLRIRIRLILCAVCMLALFLIIRKPVIAHGYLIRAIPANGDVLQRSPARIQVWFTENLEPKFSNLTLTNDKGEIVPLEQNGVSPSNPAQLSARLPQPLENGAYILTMRVAFTSDGHVQSETLVFWVGERSGNLAAANASNIAIPLEVIWRALSLIGLNILFGATLLFQFVLLPAWGNPRYLAGKLPPRVMSRLTAIMIGAFAFSIVGTILAILQQSAILFATDISNVVQNRLWSVVLSTTQVGSVLSIRLTLLIIVAMIQYGAWNLTVRQPQYVTLLWTLNSIATAFLLGTLSVSSHAASTTLWTPISIGVDYLHILANAMWVGGLIALSLTIPTALFPLEEVERRGALSAVLRQFAKLGTACVILLITTGIYNALLHVRQPSDLPGTNYGLTLIAKIILILPMFLIAWYHHTVATSEKSPALSALAKRLLGLNNSIRLESGIGLSIVLAAALLAATPPPRPPTTKQAAPLSQATTVNGWDVTLTADPGSVGANSYEVRILNGQDNVTDAQVKLQLVYPSLDKRKPIIMLDDAGNGIYLGAGSELERSGLWNALIDVKPLNQAQSFRAAFQLDVPATTTSITQQEPTLFNWLSALSVLVACLWLITPPTVRFIRTLNLHTESVLIGIAAAIGTAFMLILATALLADASQKSDLLNNPIPTIVNPVLADQASVLKGNEIYTDRCASCHEGTAPNLHNRVNNRRDEELYHSIEQHKGVTLSVDERWHVINYLRSSEFLGIKR